MKKLLATLPLLAAICCASSTAFADDDRVPLKAGMQFSVGVPYTSELGAIVRAPEVPWFKVGLSATFSLSLGYKANLIVDPINFPIAPVADFDIGHQTKFTIPTVQNSPTVNFTYYDLDAGLGFGRRDHFRFMLMGGATKMVGNVYNLQQAVNVGDGISLGDPHFNVWMPNAKIAFSWLF